FLIFSYFSALFDFIVYYEKRVDNMTILSACVLLRVLRYTQTTLTPHPSAFGCHLLPQEKAFYDFYV
ncbi:MAG: hypothetical protein IIU77_01115, partial [Clostridia bacterium]|nr:hypothetical protein [Clostridia bacterium]